jgi:hypothetical protein
VLEQTSTYDSEERIFLAIPMSDPKKQHYVPKFYLKGFCRYGKLWMYDRDRGNLVQLRPETVGIAKDLYTFADEEDRRDVSAERVLSRIENAAAPIIRRIEDGQRITLDEKCELALFVGLMRYRVPDFEQEHKEFNDTVVKAIRKEMFPSVEAVEAQLARQGDRTDTESARNIFEMIRDESYDVVTNKPYYIAQMLHLGLATGEELATMEWLFVRAPQNSAFITSDDPFLIMPPRDYDPETSPRGVGIVTPGVYKGIPLTQKVYLCIQDRGLKMEEWQADRRVVRMINQDTARSHRRFLFGRDEALVRKAGSTTKPSPGHAPRSTRAIVTGLADRH